MSENPVIAAVKEQQQVEGDIHTLSTGVRVRMKPVSQRLILDMMLRIPVPQVPTFFNEAKGRDEPNPNDPGYAVALTRYEQEQGAAGLDAVMMFGLELVDGLPEDASWTRKLNLLGIEFNPDDLVECEYHYKRYIALGNDLEQLQRLMGVTAEGVQQAKKS